MAAYKWSMIFTYFSGTTPTQPTPVRLGGWSESFYTLNYDGATVRLFQTLIQKRLALCPLGTFVNRTRIQIVDPAQASQLNKVQFAAPASYLSDIPQMALKIPFFIGGNTGQILREFRGVPDAQVVTGEYQPTNPYVTAVTAFTDELTNGTWRARRRDRTQPSYRINSIGVGGLVTMIDATVGIAQGSNVQVIRTINPATGHKIGYFATVTNFVDASHFTLSGPGVIVSNFGKLRLQVIRYDPFANPQTNAIEAVPRKVGRVFRSYSGRASRRR